MSHFFFIMFLLLSSANSVSFRFPRFDQNSAGILYHGDAVPTYGAVQLNQVNDRSLVGWARYSKTVPIWDNDTGKVTDFTTNYTFSIDTLGLNSAFYGHGFTFFLAPVGFQIPPNSASGFLGLFNTTTSDSFRNQIVLVEFDTYPNPEWDPPFQHVGINDNSISSVNYTVWNASLHRNDIVSVLISYSSTTKNLSVAWRCERTSSSFENTSLSHLIDLRKALPQWAIVGFSAATGGNIERHTLRSWEFSSSLEMKEAARESNSKKVEIITGVAVSVIVLVVGAVKAFAVLWGLRKQEKTRAIEGVDLASIYVDTERGAKIRRFSRKDLALATNFFSSEMKLGEGRFGEVYRGYIADINMTVVVKNISRGYKRVKKEYLTKKKIISCLWHQSLVKLIGWCRDKGELLLVYEFMSNGSLHSQLFCKRSPFPWAARYKISLELASALLYLHEEWEQCVVHGDIKSSSVMLDSNFNVKLDDFGLARLKDHELSPQATGLAGRLGYLAPEYVSTGRASKESDVFSFGVVALEIATGKKCVGLMKQESSKGLVECVWDLYGRGELLSAMDSRFQSDFDSEQLECLMLVGLWCASPDCNMRPSIRQAIQVLNFEITVPELPKTMLWPTNPAPSA